MSDAKTETLNRVLEHLTVPVTRYDYEARLELDRFFEYLFVEGALNPGDSSPAIWYYLAGKSDRELGALVDAFKVGRQSSQGSTVRDVMSNAISEVLAEAWSVNTFLYERSDHGIKPDHYITEVPDDE